MKQIKGIGNTVINKKYAEDLKEIHSIEACIKLVLEKENKISLDDIETVKRIAEEKYNSIINEGDISVITIYDEEYPAKFNALMNKRPVIIYVKGNVKALSNKNISVIGTRQPSIWSEKIEYRMVQKIIELSNRTIVSGLALGCDRIAHEAAVNSKEKTIAVLPSGVNEITPSIHKGLAERIIETGGCLLSEYEPSAKALRANYIERDTLIAALSDAVIAIECKVESGTMHTVDAAEKMKRKLACYYSEDKTKGDYSGNYYMIKNKTAVGVSDTDDLKVFLDSLDKIKIEDSKEEVRQLSFYKLIN